MDIYVHIVLKIKIDLLIF